MAVIVELKELSAAESKKMLEVIIGIIGDQVALAQHFESKSNSTSFGRKTGQTTPRMTDQF
jgi:hypothetical protein